MKHLLSKSDHDFKHQVETCRFPVPEFNHRAHIRLAYVYLVENNTDIAVRRMRNSLCALLKYAKIDPSQKYHETLTKAWVLAVHHFMNQTDSSESADHFIEQNTLMLDSNIMMTHYSEKILFSEPARQAFIQPDLEPIPRYVA